VGIKCSHRGNKCFEYVRGCFNLRVINNNPDFIWLFDYLVVSLQRYDNDFKQQRYDRQ
jgi:hypothetical protein